MSGPRRPAPVLTDDNEGFWAAAAERRLVVQRCRGCGARHHPPRPMCPDCRSLDLEMADVSGRGIVYSYSLLHHPRHPAFSYPVVAVLVDLEEGARVLSNLVGVEPADVRIGMEVQVTFAATADEAVVPVFEPRR
ncbi:MAG: Zn-ribbon domain-containing OB-fold protein [Pseudonocardia sp.]|nr:Zn-ribbon domain-containing OB-fold protein [Pseudonocardia sp.]